MMCKRVEPESNEIDVRHCKELLQEILDAANRIAYAIESKQAERIEQETYFRELVGELDA